MHIIHIANVCISVYLDQSLSQFHDRFTIKPSGHLGRYTKTNYLIFIIFGLNSDVFQLVQTPWKD